MHYKGAIVFIKIYQKAKRKKKKEEDCVLKIPKILKFNPYIDSTKT